MYRRLLNFLHDLVMVQAQELDALKTNKKVLMQQLFYSTEAAVS